MPPRMPNHELRKCLLTCLAGLFSDHAFTFTSLSTSAPLDEASRQQCAANLINAANAPDARAMLLCRVKILAGSPR